MKKLLIIEDNVELAFGLRNNLEIEGYDVSVATSGAEGAALVMGTRLDAVILDLTLPGIDGFRVLKTVRDAGIASPVLVLTAKGDEADKVRALKIGADDYVTKPFGILELLARVEALIRRSSPPPRRQLDRFGSVVVDHLSRTVTRRGSPVVLSRKEFDLLAALLAKPNAVISRLELMRAVWGYSDAVITRTVDTHIAELRRKLEENPPEPKFIVTVPTIGYRFEPGTQ